MHFSVSFGREGGWEDGGIHLGMGIGSWPFNVLVFMGQNKKLHVVPGMPGS